MKEVEVNNDKLRPIAIFAAVVFVLLALIVGGIRFAKSRNASYASVQQPAPVATNQGQQQPQKPEDTKPGPQSQVQSPSVSAPTPAPTPAQSAPTQSSTPAQTPSTGPHEVPATGPTSLGEFLLTGIFIGLAAYFALMIKRSRLAYRRLLSQ